MQPTSRPKTKTEKNDSEIDIRSVENAFVWTLNRLTAFVTSRKGTVGARQNDFKIMLQPLREHEEVIPGLKEALNVFEAAPAAGAQSPSPDDMLTFVLALQSALSAETNHFTPLLKKQRELFKTQRSEWFPELFGQDLPYIPDADQATYGGRERIVIEEPVLA